MLLNAAAANVKATTTLRLSRFFLIFSLSNICCYENETGQIEAENVSAPTNESAWCACIRSKPTAQSAATATTG